MILFMELSFSFFFRALPFFSDCFRLFVRFFRFLHHLKLFLVDIMEIIHFHNWSAVQNHFLIRNYFFIHQYVNALNFQKIA